LKRALVTAHPDDEVLWCGGLLQRGDWTVICCSIPRRDPIRAYKFFDACAVLGVSARLFPAIEPNPSENMPYLDDVSLEEFDHIVTHNQWGEYGHLHHRNLHEHIKGRYAHKKLTFIGFREGGRGEHEIRLSAAEMDKKLSALRKYDHCLPYGNGCPPKWEALLHRYCTTGGLNLAIETYDGAAVA
jgi:hypothetical protein